MKKISNYYVLGIVCLLLSSYSLKSQEFIEKGLSAINERTTKAQLEFLASDWTEGREMGQKGAYIASDYILSIMKSYGVEAYKGNYFQYFSPIQYTRQDGETCSISVFNSNSNYEYNLVKNTDYYIDVTNNSIKLNSEIVIAYDKFKGNYDNYFKSVGLKGKTVVVLGVEEKENKSSLLSTYLKKHQAALVLHVVDSKKIEQKQTILPKRYKSKTYEGDKPEQSYINKKFYLQPETFELPTEFGFISKKSADLILKQSALFPFNSNSKIKRQAQKIKNVKFKLDVKLSKKAIKCRNITGIIKGEDSSHAIIVGAHYDHYGKYNGYIWNGADDNASGVIGMLNIAKAISESGKKPKYDIIFVAFSGEEKGLLGSTAFARSLDDKQKYVYMLNLDMISRDSKKDKDKNACMMIMCKNEKLKSYLENSVKEYELNISLKYWMTDGLKGGSDHSPFARKSIPFNFFWAGFHDDYHRPSDEVSKTNWEKLVNVSKLGYIHIMKIMDQGL